MLAVTAFCLYWRDPITYISLKIELYRGQYPSIDGFPGKHTAVTGRRYRVS